MQDKNKIYFCWVMFGGNPHPQKWFGHRVNSNTNKEYSQEYLAYSKLLTEQEHLLTLDELAQKYPFERKKENAS